MIENELVLLGLLKERPKHGYEIKKEIKKILSLFAGVQIKSIYYPLQVLEKKGFIAKHAAKPGKRPERIVYALTPKGAAHFSELLKKSFLDIKRPQFSLDLSLYFLNYIDPKIARRRLRGRKSILDSLSRQLSALIKALKTKKSLTFIPILEHNLQMLEAEAKFLNHIVIK